MEIINQIFEVFSDLLAGIGNVYFGYLFLIVMPFMAFMIIYYSGMGLKDYLQFTIFKTILIDLLILVSGSYLFCLTIVFILFVLSRLRFFMFLGIDGGLLISITIGMSALFYLGISIKRK